MESHREAIPVAEFGEMEHIPTGAIHKVFLLGKI
jgi:hypothetical protein